MIGLTCVLAMTPLAGTMGQEPTPGTAETLTGRISGRVVDQESTRPVSGVLVRVVGTSIQGVSGESGRFLLSAVPAGRQELALEHLSYGEHRRWVDLEASEHLLLEARISNQAIELAPILVEMLSEIERRRVASGTQSNEVTRPDVDQAHRTGQNLGELIRQHIPGASIRPGRFGGACLEFRGGRGGGECRELTTFVDGVRIADPGLFLSTVPPNQIERMEILSSAEAGARYGSVSGFGVLLVETRRTPGPRPRTASARPALDFDWAEEPRPHAWKRVFASSFVANALGVGLSLAAANQCLWRTEAGSLGLRTRCGGATTTGIALMSLGLPTLGGSAAARWGGETEQSRGQITPTSLAAAMGVASGYMLLIHGSRSSEVLGGAILGLGVPMVMTLGDRIFRVRR